MGQNKNTVWVIAIAGVVALLVALSMLRKSPDGNTKRDRDHRAHTAERTTDLASTTEKPPRPPAKDHDPEKQTPQDQDQRQKKDDASPDEPKPGKQTAPEQETWERTPSVDFTPDELDRAGEGAQVNLGDYRVRKGDVFDLKIRLTAPPLESVTLLLNYDPDMIEFIDDSARPLGPFFRQGIEFYVDEAIGRAVLIHSGIPGKKNMNSATGTPVAAVRVRALDAGDCTVDLAPGTTFTSGRGADEEFSVYGGAIHIR